MSVSPSLIIRTSTVSTSTAAPNLRSKQVPPGDPDQAIRWGASYSWATMAGGIASGEAAALLTGNTLKLSIHTGRVDVDLPIARGPLAGASLRLFGGGRKIDGRAPAVTLRELLLTMSPGLSVLVMELMGLAGQLSEDLKKRGDEALNQNVADGIDLRTIGLDLGASLVTSGPRSTIARSTSVVTYLEWVEFSVGAFGHGSHAKVTVNNGNDAKSKEFFGWGAGAFFALFPVTVCIDGQEIGFRLQPIGVEAGLFLLMNGGNIVTVDVSLALSSRAQAVFF